MTLRKSTSFVEQCQSLNSTQLNAEKRMQAHVLGLRQVLEHSSSTELLENARALFLSSTFRKLRKIKCVLISVPMNLEFFKVKPWLIRIFEAFHYFDLFQTFVVLKT